VPTHPRRLGALLRAVYLVPRYSVIQSARLQDESLVRLLLMSPHGKVAMESHGRAESPRQFHARCMIAGQLIKMQSAPRRSGSTAYILAVGYRIRVNPPIRICPSCSQQRGSMPDFFPTKQPTQGADISENSAEWYGTAQQQVEARISC
jgi:hypothetical protein